jgi:hypothetical protein
LNITTTIKDVGMEVEVNVQEQKDLKYYCEMPNSPTPTSYRKKIQ